jgi:hypothetical protein
MRESAPLLNYEISLIQTICERKYLKFGENVQFWDKLQSMCRVYFLTNLLKLYENRDSIWMLY